MTVITTVPVTFDPADAAHRVRVDRSGAGFELLTNLIAIAQKLIHPRAAYGVAYIDAKGDRTVKVGGVVFQSRIFRQNLETVNKVFPYLITIGPELERTASAHGDLLMQYYLEETANMALEQAADWLARHLEEHFGVANLSNMSPGSLEDWPITEQAKLFSIFGDTEKLIGVHLTDTMLMIPRKSISGILFPSEEGFVACQLCERGHCPGRKAAYTGGL